MELSHLLPLVVGLVVALAVTPIAIRIAHAVDAVDRPRDDRWHRRETPLLGGIAISVGLLAALLVGGGTSPATLATAGGVLLLFVVGLVDDLRGVRPAVKLVAQTAAAGVLVLGGVRAGWPEDALLSVPLTVLWVVGITNAVNLLDNMDGLASGIAGISGLAVAGCALALPDGVGVPAALAALAVSGAAFGFLPYNVNPARVFMGDAGSLPLGFALASASLLATHREAGQLAIVLVAPLLALAVPILDTTLVSVVRKWHGRAISQGGRDHLSHRLVALGVPEREAVRTLWLVAAILGGFAVAVTQLDLLGTAVLVVLGLLASAVLGVVLGRVKVYAPTKDVKKAARTEELRKTFANYVRVGGPIGGDFLLAGAAYVAAYVLRYEGELADVDRRLLEESILVVITAQLACLAAARVYRGIWRYFGIRDAASLLRGTLAGTALTALILMFGWRESTFSRSVIVLDGALLVLFLFGARSLARFVSEAFGGFSASGERVLVVGAGEPGTLCLRALRMRDGAAVTPVGILDDDPTLLRRRIHGVPVLGTTGDLSRVLTELDPHEVVLSSLPEDARLDELRKTTRAAGVRLTLSPYAKAFVPL